MNGELESPENLAIVEDLKQEVRAFGPEKIDTDEKKAHVLDTYKNGLDVISVAVAKEAGVWNKVKTNVGHLLHRQPQLSTEEFASVWMWNIDDVARSFLTKPLPKQAFQFEKGELDYETGLPPTPERVHQAEVADKIQWWSVLSREQKQALSEVIGLDLTVGDNYQPPPDLANKNHILLQGSLIRFGEPGRHQRQFYPVFVWQGEGAFGLSALPKRVERSFHKPLERIGHAARNLRSRISRRAG